MMMYGNIRCSIRYSLHATRVLGYVTFWGLLGLIFVIAGGSSKAVALEKPPTVSGRDFYI